MEFAKVALARQHLGAFIYELGTEATIGSIVKAPLRNGELLGLVIEKVQKPNHATRVITQPPFAQTSTAYVEFIKEASRLYCANLGSAVNAALPSKAVANMAEQDQLHPDAILPKLSKAQKECLEQTLKCFAQTGKPVLLHGVTGSGKTMIYFHLAERAMQEGKQVLILLPEIALANQIAVEFAKAFGYKATVWHSQIKASERSKSFSKIISGRARAIIGVRSAILLPYKNLGTIVVDEEHDASYKQESYFCYNARDMAILRVKTCKSNVVLGSATPSMESYLNAKLSNYHYVELKERFSKVQFPQVTLLSMQNEPKAKASWVCDKLKSEIQSSLDKGQQALLFLNRKGYAPLVLCSKCGHREKCPSCSTWLVFYRQDNLLRCHYCAHAKAMPNECPDCKATKAFTACGPGIERIAEEVRKCFPKYKIATASRDDDAKKLDGILTSFQNKEMDILVGTQILTKGHHFPHLSLVGVIDADIGLNGGDFRALERTFQVLHQVSGRSGRENSVGRVYIQTYFAGTRLMELLKENDFIGFINEEIEQRKKANLPPFRMAIKLLVESKEKLKAKNYADELAQIAPRQNGISFLGPVEARVHQIKMHYRFKVLILAKGGIQEYAQSLLARVKVPSGVRLKVDVDPYDFD